MNPDQSINEAINHLSKLAADDNLKAISFSFLTNDGDSDAQVVTLGLTREDCLQLIGMNHILNDFVSDLVHSPITDLETEH